MKGRSGRKRASERERGREKKVREEGRGEPGGGESVRVVSEGQRGK